jgi:hypothetical protein
MAGDNFQSPITFYIRQSYVQDSCKFLSPCRHNFNFLNINLFSPQTELYIRQVRVRLKRQTVQNRCQKRTKHKFISQCMLRQQNVMVNERTAIIEIGLVSAH